MSDLFVIHSKEGVDFLYRAQKRSEVLYHLMHLYQAMTGDTLLYNYSEKLFVGEDNVMMRDVTIIDSLNVKYGPASTVLPKY